MKLAMAISAAALALAGCGGNDPREAPPLVESGTLSFDLLPAPGTDGGGAPAEFHLAVLEDVAARLNLGIVTRDTEIPSVPRRLTGRDADAAAPMPIRELTAGALDYSAPYYEDPGTGTLYGIAVLAGPDPGEETDLLEDLNEALSELKDDGTLQQLYDEWLPGTEVPDPVLNDATT